MSGTAFHQEAQRQQRVLDRKHQFLENLKLQTTMAVRYIWFYMVFCFVCVVLEKRKAFSNLVSKVTKSLVFTSPILEKDELFKHCQNVENLFARRN